MSNYINHVRQKEMIKEINKEDQTKAKLEKVSPASFYIKCLNNSHNAANPKYTLALNIT